MYFIGMEFTFSIISKRRLGLNGKSDREAEPGAESATRMSSRFGNTPVAINGNKKISGRRFPASMWVAPRVIFRRF